MGAVEDAVFELRLALDRFFGNIGKKQKWGKTKYCPACGTANPENADNCSKCYRSFKLYK